MSTEQHQITVNGLTVDVVRKDIKNLHLAVYPPHGRIRVAAPLLVNDEAVRLAVILRLAWIKRHQARFHEQDRQSEREYVSGESHYFQGDRYRLVVVEHDGPGQVIVRNRQTLELRVRPESTPSQRERILYAWYRAYIKQIASPLIDKWAELAGVEVASWGVKRMKTKWGSCNIEAGRIWLNLELAKKSIRCLEYIIVHEMVHLIERHHNDRFVEHMSQLLPHWRILRDELNQAFLAYETWDY
jgi:predicted metal-dependent hydrolase